MEKKAGLQTKIRNWKKGPALVLMTALYIVALGLGGIIIWFLRDTGLHPTVIAFFADVGATIFIYIVSELVRNASAYDPYWSVIPPFILLYFWSFSPNAFQPSLRQVIVLALVLVWAIRLTGNWVTTWKNWTTEDWRYTQYRVNHPKLFWLINFTGIQLFPTILVFLGSLAFWPVFADPKSSASSMGISSLSLLDLWGFILAIAAISFEFFADIQIHRFIRDPKNHGKTIKTGLWGLCRHPNYLGEITWWWALFWFGLAANSGYWWTIAGPVLMLALFLGISIPMMEKRNLQRRQDYPEYQKSTPKLVPFIHVKKH